MNRPIHPRSLLKWTAAAGLGALSPLPAAAAKKERPLTDPGHPPIVDTHQHLWDLKQFRLPWLSGQEKLNHNFLMEDYYAATAGLNVVKTVYMEVDLEPGQQVQEAEYVIETCRRDDNPMAAGVISG